MAVLAGTQPTAGSLTNLQPKLFQGVCSSALAGAQSSADVPGCSVTFTTLTANAAVKIDWTGAFYMTAATTTLGSCRPIIDSTTVAPMFAVYSGSGTSEKGNSSNTWLTTIAAAGSHTIKLQCTLPAGMQIQVYSTICVTVLEVV